MSVNRPFLCYKLLKPIKGEMVAVAQLVESQLVELVVTGSSPVGHPRSARVGSTKLTAQILCIAYIFYIAKMKILSRLLLYLRNNFEGLTTE